MIRRMIAVAGMLVAMAGASGAQAAGGTAGGGDRMGAVGGRGGMRGMQRQEEMMFKGIALTADQKARIDAIRKQQKADRQGIDRQSTDGRAKMLEARNKSMAAIKAVLTPEQLKAYDANREEMQKTMQKRRRPPAP